MNRRDRARVSPPHERLLAAPPLASAQEASHPGDPQSAPSARPTCPGPTRMRYRYQGCPVWEVDHRQSARCYSVRSLRHRKEILSRQAPPVVPRASEWRTTIRPADPAGRPVCAAVSSLRSAPQATAPERLPPATRPPEHRLKHELDGSRVTFLLPARESPPVPITDWTVPPKDHSYKEPPIGGRTDGQGSRTQIGLELLQPVLDEDDLRAKGLQARPGLFEVNSRRGVHRRPGRPSRR